MDVFYLGLTGSVVSRLIRIGGMILCTGSGERTGFLLCRSLI